MSKLTASSTAIPLAPLPDDVANHVQQTGTQQVNLYRALAHAPKLLRAWIDFASALREQCKTPRQLRELVILRTALSEHFDSQARVELTLTAAFYCGVPRLLDALRVPTETSPTSADSDRKDKG